MALIQAAEELGVRYHTGITASTDSFYTGQGRPALHNYLPSFKENILRDMQAAGVKNFEMEVAPLLTFASIFGMRAGAICFVIASRVTDEFEIRDEWAVRTARVASRAIAILAQWDEKKKKYVYDRAGFENTPQEQLEFGSEIIKKYKLIYAEDVVHEEAFEERAILTSKFPNVLIAGDDLVVTNTEILKKAAKLKSCNAAILKVNQAGSLYDALEFAAEAHKNNIKLITSHRSGESIDSHISHIGIATESKMLKVGVVGGERVAKLNELIRIAEYDLIRGMAQI
jgi:hypothetical protein